MKNKTLEIFEIENILNNVNIIKLDIYEKMMLNNLIEKSFLSKSNALKIIINNTEGDFSQLSAQLRKIAKKYFI